MRARLGGSGYRALYTGACVALAFSVFAGCSEEADQGPGPTGTGGATGGSSTGGVVSATGGTTTGGTPATGGTSSGGTTGGTTTGGNPATGGVAPGGSGGVAATGGGGASTGGAMGGGGSSAGGPGGGSGGKAVAGAGGAGGGGAAGSAGQASAGSAGAAGSAAYSPCPSTGACAVLPLGDSITEGFGSSGGGYRVELFRRSLQEGKKITFVGSQQNGPPDVDGTPFPKNHQGHGGYTIDSGGGQNGISGQITNNALMNYKPHIVLLMIGTNDVNGNVDVNNAPTRLGKLMDDIIMRAPDSLLVVSTIMPIDKTDSNQKAVAYNNAIPKLVEDRAKAGKHVVLLDNYKIFSSQPNFRQALMGDYLHPNNAGYAVLGKSFYDAIAPSLP